MLPRPTTTTNTEAGIGGGKDIENSVNPPLPSSNVGSEDVVGTSSGSSISDKKVEGEDPTTAHVSSPSQSPASLTPKDGENSGSPTVSTSSQSNTAPQLKIGGGGGFGSAVVGNAKSNAFSSLAGLNENGKWMGNIEGGTIPRGQELWGGLTQLTSSSELGNSSIYVEEKGIKGLIDPNEVITGEEDEDCLLQVRARLYQLLDGRTSSTQKEGTDTTTIAASNLPKNIYSTNEEGSKQPEASTLTNDDTKEVVQEDVENVGEMSTKPEIKGCGEEGANEIVSAQQQRSEWVEVGTGPVKVLQRKDNKATRVVMRRESHPGGPGTKVILNERLHGHIFLIRQAENALLLTLPLSTCTEPGKKPTTVSFRCKHSEEVDKLLSVIQECIAQQQAATH